MEPYLTFDIISVRYKDKGTSLMTSQWRFQPRRPLSLPPRYDLVTLCLCGDLGQINVIAGILKLRKRFRMSQILFEHGINSLPLACFRGYGHFILCFVVILLSVLVNSHDTFAHVVPGCLLTLRQSYHCASDNEVILKDMGQVKELWLSCYLVLLSIDSKTR